MSKKIIGANILILEDEKTLLDIYREEAKNYLSLNPYTAGSLDEGITILYKLKKDNIRLRYIVTDFKLGPSNKTSEPFVKEARKLFPNAFIALVTGSLEEVSELAPDLFDLVDFKCDKPTSIRNVINCLEQNKQAVSDL